MTNSKLKGNFSRLSITVFFLFCALTAAGIYARFFLPDLREVNVQLHSALEAAGAVAGLTLAMLILLRKGRDNTHLSWVASGLIAMGILDIFHATQPPSGVFVWLHSIAFLLGGLLFAMVWLPLSNVSWLPRLLPASTVAFSLGVVAYSFAGGHPAMIENGEFSAAAKWMNTAGGALFFAASLRFMGLYLRGGRMDNMLFMGLSFLYATSGPFFHISHQWDAEWWLWHFLRLAAGIGAFIVVLMIFRRSVNRAVSEQQFRKAIEDSVSYGIAVVDLQGRIKYANTVFCSMVDWDMQEPGETAPPVPFLPQEGDGGRDFLKRLLSADEGKGELEARFAKSDGRDMHVVLKARPLPDCEGQRTGWVISAFDITSRKLMEEDLRRSREAERLLLDSTAEGIYGLDLKGNCTFCNPACLRLLGYENESDLLGKNMHDLIHHSHPNGSPYPMEDCLIFKGFKEGRGTHSDEEVMWRVDGKSFSAEYWSFPTFRDGDVIGSVVTFIDITERKKAEAEIKAAKVELEARVEDRTIELTLINERLAQEIAQRAGAEAFLQTVIDGVSEPLMVIGKDYRIRLMNRAAKDCAAEPDDAWMPPLCHQISHHRETPCEGLGHPCPLDLVRETGKPQTVTHVHETVGGGKRIFEILASPLWGGDGSFEGIIETCRDVTGRHEMEEALKASLTEKDMLIKEVHHRVKNNLAVIASLLKLQSGKIEDPKAKGLFGESQNRVRSMSMIHERLYRSEDMKSVDFPEYIRSLAVQLFRSYEISESKVRLRLDIPDLKLDVDTLIPCGLIINELVSNSLKHAFPKDRTGELLIRMKKEDGSFAMTVKDTGVGLPPDLDVTKTTSLGMQIVTSLTRQLGGTLDVSSGGGTDFTIHFKQKSFS